MTMGTYFGRFVHYTMAYHHFSNETGRDLAGQVFPAIVTRDYGPSSDDPSIIEPDRVDLCVFTPEPVSFWQVPVTNTPTRGCAHPVQASDGTYSQTRFVAEDPEVKVAEEFNQKVDELSDQQQQHEEPPELVDLVADSQSAPELPGAGEPLPMGGEAFGDVIINTVENGVPVTDVTLGDGDGDLGSTSDQTNGGEAAEEGAPV